ASVGAPAPKAPAKPATTAVKK
ncbi:competence protein ComEA, partial [Neisseria meningitidis]